jgi:charged multivesicular body protein 2A
MLRESQAMLRKGIRELEREREKMQREEKKLQIEIKQVAKKGQIGAAKIMAKDLIRTRNAISKFHQMKAQLQAVSIRIQTMSSTAAMADAMKGAAKGEREEM